MCVGGRVIVAAREVLHVRRTIVIVDGRDEDFIVLNAQLARRKALEFLALEVEVREQDVHA